MKHKGTKILLAAAAVCIAVGGILLGVGMAKGGSPVFYYDGNKIHVKENTKRVERQDYIQKKTAVEEFDEMDISLIGADLEIASGEEYSVEYVLSGERMEPVCFVENGVLTIKESENWKKQEEDYGLYMGGLWGFEEQEYVDTYVKITVPEDKLFSEADIEVRSGNVRILDPLAAEMASIRVEYGQIKADIAEGTDLEIDSKQGDVQLVVRGGEEENGVSLHTQYGSIRTSDGIVEPEHREEERYETDVDYVRLSDGKAAIRVYCEYGDIRIR